MGIGGSSTQEVHISDEESFVDGDVRYSPGNIMHYAGLGRFLAITQTVIRPFAFAACFFLPRFCISSLAFTAEMYSPNLPEVIRKLLRNPGLCHGTCTCLRSLAFAAEILHF